MDYVTEAGIRAGIICALVTLAGTLLAASGWVYLHGLFTLIFLFYLAIDIFAFIFAGMLSGIYTAAYVTSTKESFKPGLIAGSITAAIPAAISFQLIIMGALGGTEQSTWVMIGLSMLFYSLVKAFFTSLLAAMYIIVARKSTIIIKFS